MTPFQKLGLARTIAAFAFVYGLAGASPLDAATFTVNTTSDTAVAMDGLCTLREAITQANNSIVLGNYIGVDATGSAALPNQIGLLELGTSSVIGSATAPNIISGNTQYGIRLGAGSGATISGNFIGTDATGTNPLPNGVGIGYFSITQNAAPTNSLVGGIGAGNRIAFNAQQGIVVVAANAIPQGHRFSANSMHGNGPLGIDLNLDGPDPIDPLDADTGPNGLQNRPVLTSVNLNGATLEIAGVIDSSPNSRYFIEFFTSPACDPAGAGEGETYLGTVQVSTDATGSAAILASFPSPGGGGVITATATDDATNENSEFSDCIPLQTPVGTNPEIPTLSTWGLLLLALLLSAGALMLLRRKGKARATRGEV